MGWSEAESVLTCASSGVDHALAVATPFRYPALDAAPLILCLDGAWTAGTVRDATRIMSMSGESPEALVAGISFTDEKMGDYLRSRARWFTPTEFVPPEITVKGVEASDTGQALTYLAFIRDQVLPKLRQDYRISETWLLGHSFSGLFGLRCLFGDPGLFDKYLLMSPSIWWDDRAIFDIEADFAANRDDLNARVFLTAGGQEDALGSDFAMQANVIEMASRLTERSYPSLHIDHAIVPTESHSSTIGAAISRGIRHLTPPTST